MMTHIFIEKVFGSIPELIKSWCFPFICILCNSSRKKICQRLSPRSVHICMNVNAWTQASIDPILLHSFLCDPIYVYRFLFLHNTLDAFMITVFIDSKHDVDFRREASLPLFNNVSSRAFLICPNRHEKLDNLYMTTTTTGSHIASFMLHSLSLHRIRHSRAHLLELRLVHEMVTRVVI